MKEESKSVIIDIAKDHTQEGVLYYEKKFKADPVDFNLSTQIRCSKCNKLNCKDHAIPWAPPPQIGAIGDDIFAYLQEKGVFHVEGHYLESDYNTISYTFKKVFLGFFKRVIIPGVSHILLRSNGGIYAWQDLNNTGKLFINFTTYHVRY